MTFGVGSTLFDDRYGLAAIGRTDQANHQYDVSDFTDALNGTGGARLRP